MGSGGRPPYTKMFIPFRGRGLFLFLLGVLAVALVKLAADHGPSSLSGLKDEDIAFVAMGFVTGFLTFLFSKYACPRAEQRLIDEETGESLVLTQRHSLFFIEVKYWVVLFPLLSLLALVDWEEGSDWIGHRDLRAALQSEVTSKAEVFCPKQISDGMFQRDIALSSDGTLFLYTLQASRSSRIMFSHKHENAWSEPAPVSFGGEWRDLEPAFLPGSHQLFFASHRPLPQEAANGDANLWRTEWKEGAWVEPTPIVEINTEGDEYYPSLANDGTLYFTSKAATDMAGENIWSANASATGFDKPTP